ncbi:hypothetical protein B0H14DRAFT_3888297, partial [Mycena olivaceomarginata]
CKRRKTRCDPNSPCLQCSKRSEDCERPTAELVKAYKRKFKATDDIAELIAALAKLTERLDFLEATVFGWTLPVEQSHHKRSPQNCEEASNPWAEALLRNRTAVADQALSGSTAYDDASPLSGSDFGANFPLDRFSWDGQSESSAPLF